LCYYLFEIYFSNETQELDANRALCGRNNLYPDNRNDPWIYGVPFNSETIMDDLIDTLNEIIATGDNCNLPYISILGRKAKQQAIESIIKRSRNGEYV
jgi:hypothetical protein